MEKIDAKSMRKDDEMNKILRENEQLKAQVNRITSHVAQGNNAALIAEVGGNPNWASQMQQPQQQYQQYPQQNQVVGNPQTEVQVAQLQKQVNDLTSQLQQTAHNNQAMQESLDFQKQLSHHLSSDPDAYPFTNRAGEMLTSIIVKNLMENDSISSIEDALDEAETYLKGLYSTLGGPDHVELEEEDVEDEQPEAEEEVDKQEEEVEDKDKVEVNEESMDPSVPKDQPKEKDTSKEKSDGEEYRPDVINTFNPEPLVDEVPSDF